MRRTWKTYVQDARAAVARVWLTGANCDESLSRRNQLWSIRAMQQFTFFLSGLFLAASLLASGKADAHSGGLNSQGCHAGSRPYHCHRAPSEMVRTQDGRNRLRCDLGSRSRECVVRSRPEIKALQHQLMEHCASLPDGFADGMDGPATRHALRRFQLAHGLVPDAVYGPQTAAALAGNVSGLCE